MRYQIKHGIVKYAADTILDDINFEIRDSEKIAVVGRNGCGKTTLLKFIAGEIAAANIDSDEDFEVSMAGTQRIGYLKQLSFEDPAVLVEDEISKVFEPVFEAEKKLRLLEEKMAVNCTDEILYEYANVQAVFESLGGYTYRQDLELMFQKFGFELEDLKRPVGTFSGGQQTRFAFIRLLLSRPDIMLLDEPTNHLDLPTIEWLEGYLKNYDKAVVIVSHDRMFLDRVIDVTYEIEYHGMKRYVGNYSEFVKTKQLMYEKQQKDYEEQQKEIARLTAWIEKWKNTPTKVAATRSKRMAIEHMVKIEKPRRYDLKSFHAQFSPRIDSYSEVLKINKLEIGYDTVLNKVSMKLMKGEKIAVIGKNGIGKSTLLKTLVGKLNPISGEYTYGTDVEWGYFDQQEALEVVGNPKQTVIDNFWEEYPTLMQQEVRKALGNFLFSQDEVFKELGQLSGGEKVRLALCKMFKKRPNLLILDEPTNHMDIVGKETLEWMLKKYTGTVLFVSHDRYFISQVATALLVFEEDNVTLYPMTYEKYMEMKAEKEEAKRKKLLEKLETKLEESSNRVLALKIQLVDPTIASDYEKLYKIQEEIDAEEARSLELLEELAELEIKADTGEVL